jgi:hypothetical protein
MSVLLCHKTVGKGKQNEKENTDIYIYSKIGSSPITILLNFSPSLVR